MNLLYLLKLRKPEVPKQKILETKQEFIDEDLSVEEINEKIGNLSWKEAQKYVTQLSSNKKREAFKYASKEFFGHIEKENKKCIKEHGMSLYDYYDIEHPAD